MRVLYIIISVFSLLLLGLSTIEIRQEREFCATVRDVQRLLAEIDARSVGQAHQAALDRIARRDRAWIVVACGSAAIFVFGIGGIILERKKLAHKVATSYEGSSVKH
jgi:hypothetical protein